MTILTGLTLVRMPIINQTNTRPRMLATLVPMVVIPNRPYTTTMPTTSSDLHLTTDADQHSPQLTSHRMQATLQFHLSFSPVAPEINHSEERMFLGIIINRRMPNERQRASKA